MYLKRLSILNFKNIQQADLSFSPQINCFIGINGQGKTNVLDSIYYLSFCKSSNTTSDLNVIRHNEEFFMLQGEYFMNSLGVNNVICSVKRKGRKHLKWNDKEAKRFSEHWGRIPLVLISPSDSSLVVGGSEDRRRFMDSTISQYDSTYLQMLIRYENALKQRNFILRQDSNIDLGVLDIYEDIMSQCGSYIFEQRKLFLEDFLLFFKGIYSSLCNNENEVVDIEYISNGFLGDFKEQLKNGRAKERIVGYSLYGIHKDELLLKFNGFPIKQEGSQGQIKTFFIALKLSQFNFLKSKGKDKTPLLLLDDIFDKLDFGRVSNIINFVSSKDFGQIFITDTNEEHLNHIFEMVNCDFKLFKMENGVVSLQ